MSSLSAVATVFGLIGLGVTTCCLAFFLLAAEIIGVVAPERLAGVTLEFYLEISVFLTDPISLSTILWFGGMDFPFAAAAFDYEFLFCVT